MFRVVCLYLTGSPSLNRASRHERDLEVGHDPSLLERNTVHDDIGLLAARLREVIVQWLGHV